MPATGNVRQLSEFNKHGDELIVPRHGVVTLWGYGIQVRVDRGHLVLESGVGADRYYARLPRLGHGLTRLVVIGSAGMVSLAALRWLSSQDVAFSMLERTGKVLLVTGPVHSSDAKLRRAQALAHSSGAALRIARELISQKLAAQEQVARHKLLDETTANTIAQFRSALPSADCTATIRLLEAQGASAYWAAWRTLSINFPKKDLRRTPQHWCTFSARVSALTGSPRLACNPANAILNYLYSLLEAEARLAVSAMGLDPGLGVLHSDTTARDSLGFDVMEPIRAQVDSYVLQMITREYLSRSWFYEQPDGNCRLMSMFASRLSETAPTWRRAVAPVAEWVAHEVWKTIRRPDTPFTTRLTHDKKRAVKSAAPLDIPQVPAPQHLCEGCGKVIPRTSTYCSGCAVEGLRVRMVDVARKGRIASRSPLSRARLSETQRRQTTACHRWNPGDQPKWLTEEVYTSRIQPRLANYSLSQIASAMGVSIPYASDIRRGGRRPHPRNWQALANLVGISSSEFEPCLADRF
jgi:CRISPR-associated endonuclease Cas1